MNRFYRVRYIGWGSKCCYFVKNPKFDIGGIEGSYVYSGNSRKFNSGVMALGRWGVERLGTLDLVTDKKLVRRLEKKFAK